MRQQSRKSLGDPGGYSSFSPPLSPWICNNQQAEWTVGLAYPPCSLRGCDFMAMAYSVRWPRVLGAPVLW